MAQASVDYCENGRLESFPNASHWVHMDCEEVTGMLIDHLSEAVN
nr:hypothetical protein [Halostella pelagica]